MNVELISSLSGPKQKQWADLLNHAGLEPDTSWETTVLIYDEETLVATGSRMGNLLKCIAVDAAYQGTGLTATLLTHLRQDAFSAGHNHLFLYTKPENAQMFSSLFFYPIVQTAQVLLMENKKNGIGQFLSTLPQPKTAQGTVGAAVMNCNPFTLGHQYLIETAARECDWLYVFVLSEDRSAFSADDRMEMVLRGTAHFPNVTVLPTGPYLISSATFPTYFLKDRENAAAVHCLLDIELFCQYYAPHFGITRRYVGTEPLSPMTAQYNLVLQSKLPPRGIQVRQLPRLTWDNAPISASAVRSLLANSDWEALNALLPETTLAFLRENAKRRNYHDGT